MSRRLPRIFSQQFLPEFFFRDPSAALGDLLLEKKLREAWQLAAEDLRELAIKDAPLCVKPLFWRNYRAVVVDSLPAQFRGEARALVLCWREATKEPRIFYQEKAESGWALTSITPDRSHNYHQAMEQSDTESFVARARESVGS